MKRVWVGLAVTLLALFPQRAGADAPSLHFRYRTWTTEEGLPQGSVRDIAQTPDGYLWFSTFDGLVRFDGLRMVVYSRSEHPEMTSNRILALFVDRAGTLWAGTQDGGLLELHEGTFRVHGRDNGLPDDEVGSLGQDDAGVLWAYTPGGTVVLEDGRWIQPPRGRSPPASWAAVFDVPHPDTPAAMRQEQRTPVWARGAAGRVWLLHEGVLHVRENDTWRTAADPVPSVALPHARRLFEDAEGSLWIGSETGLVQAIPTPVSGIETELLGPRFWRNVFTLAEDDAGRVWVGTDSVPFVIDGEKAEILGDQPWWPRAWILTIAVDGQGGLFGGSNAGLFRIRPGRPPEHLFAGPTVFDVHRDRTGTLWVATVHGLFRSAASGWDRVEGLRSDDVKVLLESTTGAMWAGTYGGLARVAGDRVETWTSADGLSSDRIRALHEDNTGTLWIGTYDGGLNRFADGRFIAIRKRDGLFDDGVFAILEDGAGRFYMSSNRGLHSVAKSDLDAFVSGASRQIAHRAWRQVDGMPSSECNGGFQPSGFRAPDGKLWFPTQRGIAIVDPALVRPNPVPPPVVIEAVKAGGRAIAPGAAVVLSPRERDLEVHYTANTFIRPEEARFRHRLEGHDDDWVDAGTERVAHYARLRPGRYVLTVAAANSDGVWNLEGASLSVLVRPAFYQTWWFRSLGGIGAAGLGIILVRRRETSLKRAHAAQQAFSRQLIETQEAERSRIAAELHDSLGQRLVIIRNLALLANGAQDAQAGARVEEIAEESSHAIAEVREIARNLRPHHLDRLGLTKALAALVRSVGDAGSIVVTGEIDPIDGVFPAEAEIHVYRAVQESLSNILKHAQATTASVTVRRSPERVTVTVRDNGVGFEHGVTGPSGGGFGLTGIAERVRLLGGRTEIRSGPGAGTTVALTFDLRSSS